MRRLRSVRVRLLLGFAPLALLMLVFAGKVLLMVGANESGREAYAQQAYETAEADFGRNRRGDLLQDWVASYNRGTTLVRMHRYEEARADLERALARVPAEYDCMVRVNLVLAMEGQADDLMTQRRAADAEQLYAAARELLRQGSCGSPESTSPSPGASGSQSASRRPSS
ncbi:MAG: tetratricopeptide repeat protein, partial [Actinomycetia bacterium]|nr:tetratricopeptide repeat protein [Actinomycetes bacterium]